MTRLFAALFERNWTGKGRYVTTSLFEAQLPLHVNPLGSAHPNLAPYQAFRANDGHFVIAAGSDRLYQRMCKAIGGANLADDDRFRTNAGRVSNREELVQLLEAVLVDRSVAESCTILDDYGVPNALILDLAQVNGHPRTQALNMVHSVNHVVRPLPQVSSPISLDGHRLTPRLAPPTLGQHTREVLAEIGVDSDSLAALFAAGTIAQHHRHAVDSVTTTDPPCMDIWTVGWFRLTDDVALCGIWPIGLFLTREVVSPWLERSRGHFRNLVILF